MPDVAKQQTLLTLFVNVAHALQYWFIHVHICIDVCMYVCMYVCTVNSSLLQVNSLRLFYIRAGLSCKIMMKKYTHLVLNLHNTF